MSDDLVHVPHSVPIRPAGDRTVCTTKTRWLACNMKAVLLTAGSWVDARQPLAIPPSSWVFLWSLFLRECSLTSGACQTAEPEVQACSFDTRGVSSSVFCWRTAYNSLSASWIHWNVAHTHFCWAEKPDLVFDSPLPCSIVDHFGILGGNANLSNCCLVQPTWPQP